MTKLLRGFSRATILLLALISGPLAEAKGMTTQEAFQYFQEADALVRADGGKGKFPRT